MARGAGHTFEPVDPRQDARGGRACRATRHRAGAHTLPPRRPRRGLYSGRGKSPLKLTRRPGAANFYIRGTVAGQSIFESTGLDDKKLAEKFRARREAQILQRHALGRGATLTFAEAALTYLESGGEGRHLARVLEYFGPETLLAEIDNDAVNRAARALYPVAAPATITRQLITPVSAVLNMAAADGLCPPRRLRRRGGDQARVRWLTPEEAEALLGAVRQTPASRHILRAVALLIGGGCRTGEAIAIEAGAFYPETGEAWLGKTKNGDARMIRLPRRALDIMLETDLPTSGAILRTPRNIAYKLQEAGGGQLAHAFNAARDAAGLGREVTPHILRHTWATWYYSQTKDFGGLMDLGGWRKSDMANRYRKIAPENLGARLLEFGWDFTRPEFAGARAAPAILAAGPL